MRRNKYTSAKTLMKLVNRLLIVVLLVAMFPMTTFAKSISDLQAVVDEDSVELFLPEMSGDITETKAQIGNIANAEVTLTPISDTGEKLIHTTILFDNSLSIAEANRDTMKAIAAGIVSGHAKNEVFSLYTIDTELREVLLDSTDYEELVNKINAIQFSNQDTYLKNDLYSAFTNADSESNVFQRFVIFSDGTDDNTLGYTYNDITRVIDDKHYAVCAVGSKYDNKIKDLEDMFSIARAASSTYVLVEPGSDVEKIVKQVNGCVPKYIASVQIPDAAKNGSTQKIKVQITTSKEEYTFTTTAEMPFSEIKAESESEEITDEATESEAVVESEPVTKETPNGFNPIILALILAVVIIAIVVIVILKSRKPAKKQVAPQPVDREEEDDSTVLIENEDEDDSTILMRPDEDEEATFIAKTVVMVAEDRSREFSFKCSMDVRIGRKDICEVQIKGDKAVSGVHCIVSCDVNGDPVIRDNNSSNGTYLNDQKLIGEQPLNSGDTIEIGHMRYTVQIVG